MAVRIDIDAFRESIPTTVAEAAARLLSNGSVGELEPAGGGVQARRATAAARAQLSHRDAGHRHRR